MRIFFFFFGANSYIGPPCSHWFTSSEGNRNGAKCSKCLSDLEEMCFGGCHRF